MKLSLESRVFFHTTLLANVPNRDRAVAEKAPIAAFERAVLALEGPKEALSFLEGHVYWLRGKRPRTAAQALEIAKRNIQYVLDGDTCSEETRAMWGNILQAETLIETKEDAKGFFAQAASVSKKLAEGKDPGAQVSLARAALARKS